MTDPRANVAMVSSNNTASLLFLEHDEDGDPWSSSSASSNRDPLDRAFLGIDYTNGVLPVPAKLLLHDSQNFIFILKTALWHLVPSFIPSPRYSSHALPLKRPGHMYIDGVRGGAATFLF